MSSSPPTVDEATAVRTVCVDAAGCFIVESDSALEGNFRINSEEALQINVPAGAVINQTRCQLRVESGNGNVTFLQPASTDVFGNSEFFWSMGPADATGPVSFQFSCCPLESSVVPASTTPPPTTGPMAVTPSSSPQIIVGPVNRIIVEPVLRRRLTDEPLRLRGICMQTVLPNCLGPMDRWISTLVSGSASCKYNMIHFTPVQVRGESGSCYSLADQLRLSPSLLPAGPPAATADGGWSALARITEQARVEHGLFSACDIVLNHVANNCPWLAEHVECGYHQENSPWLRAAIELDQRIQDFSHSVSQEYYCVHGLSSYISDESALRALRRLLQEHVLVPFRIGEWFTIGVTESVNAWRAAAAGGAAPVDTVVNSGSSNDNLPMGERLNLLERECCKSIGVARHNGVVPSGDVTRNLFGGDEGQLRAALQQVQERLWRRASETAANILDAVEGCVRYERLECRKGRIGPEHWDGLVPRYFTPVRTTEGKAYYMANNGWVMNWSVTEDFAGPGALVYLSRSLVAWSDCVKLRYGSKPEDSPFLWNHMAQYCQLTARHFDGIRLDNCHSTPLPVAQHMLKVARSENPNIFVFAELFTGNYAVDLKFERLLGLHALIRESMQSSNASALAHHLTSWGGKVLGALDPRKSLDRGPSGVPVKIPLVPSPPPAVLCDCTHDNETPAQRRTAVDALANAAICCMAGCTVGSVRGYDELIPKTLCVVTENRLYLDYTGAAASREAKELNETAVSAAKIDPPTEPVVFRTSLRPYSRSLAVKGSWDNWTSSIPLTRKGDVWEAPLERKQSSVQPPWQYKFIDDGQHWFFDPALPHCDDGHHNTNNVMGQELLPTPVQHQLSDGPMDCRNWHPGRPLPGIMAVRPELNQLHRSLESEGFTEIDVSLRNEHFLVIRRHCPETHQICILIARTAFHRGALSQQHSQVSVRVSGKIESVCLEAALSVPHDVPFTEDSAYINGLPSSLKFCVGGRLTSNGRSSLGYFSATYEQGEDATFVKVHSLPPGGVIILRSRGCPSLRASVQGAIDELENLLPSVMGTKVSMREELVAYSYLLYSCSNEELDRSKGTRNCYALSDGRLRYAGIAGVVPYLDAMRFCGHLDTPLGQNLIAGDWLMEYMTDRLDADSEDGLASTTVLLLVKLAGWARDTFRLVTSASLTRRCRPFYVDYILSALYSWVARRVLGHVGAPLRNTTDPLVKHLCLATLQFYSYVPSSPLISGTHHASLAAGLPHFSTGFMRAWGRDTFIAIRGCLLEMNRFAEMREEILGFARVMRHGLIPNLLDSGNHPRFNARDATWFFLQSIVDYCQRAPEGTDILKAEVTLKFADALPRETRIEILADVVHFILCQHAQGISFREWNAGRRLDEHMKDEGFNIDIKLDETTGLLHGGNAFNCGSWMDKMGSSAEAGNKGTPATPRDGANVEIMGLVKSVLRFVNSLPEGFNFTVANPVTGYTFRQWETTLQKNFFRLFYIPEEQQLGELGSHCHFNKKLVNRRGILKDTVGATEEWRDYQLRPNQVVALALAPELVRNDCILKALNAVARLLLQARSCAEMQSLLEKARKAADDDAPGTHKWLQQTLGPKGLLVTPQLGPKTLDSKDLNYRPSYDNANMSTDPSVAHGFNYHNGPEWLWPLGYFLHALYDSQCRRGRADSMEVARYHTMRYVLGHRKFIATDPWLSLPEVTDENGKFCQFSCHAQAWSVGTMLAALAQVARGGSSYNNNGNNISVNAPPSPVITSPVITATSAT